MFNDCVTEQGELDQLKVAGNSGENRNFSCNER